MEQEARSDSSLSSTAGTLLAMGADGSSKKHPGPSPDEQESRTSKLLQMPEILLSVASGSTSSNNLWRGYDQEEILRLILQTLDELGYKEVVTSLEEASGVKLLTQDVRKLQQRILGGNWQQAGRALLRLPLDQVTRQGCWFLLMQHKFLETATNPNNSLEKIIECLRKDLSTAAFDPSTTERLHECSSLLMYRGSELTAHVLRMSSLCRSQLFTRVTCLLPPVVVMRPSRLATILSHARRFQVLCCPLHAEPQFYFKESLVEPHRCKMPVLPQSCVGCFHAQQKEVWAISVAPKLGNSTETLVASGAADSSVCVWLLTTDTSSHRSSMADMVDHELSPHDPRWNRWLAAWLKDEGDSTVRQEQSRPIPMLDSGTAVGTCRLLWRVQRSSSGAAFVDWDSTGTLLAAGGEAAYIEAWEEGRFLGGFCTHNGSLIALQWVPNSRRLISVGSDRTMCLLSLQQSSFALTFVMEYEWLFPARPQEALLLPGGSSVAVFFANRHAEVFDLVTKKETFWMQGKDLVVAACASKVCNQVLMSTAHSPPVLRLWDLDEHKVVQKYRGHKLGRLTIRPAFGGPAEELVISGSEDAHVYIWHRLWGCLLQQLKGHAAAVNQVAWIHSCDSICLISAGDDGVHLVWSSSKKIEKVE